MQLESPITKLTSTSLNSLLRQQSLFNNSEVTIDLTQIEFVTPGALVPLAAICHALKQKSCRTTVKLRDNDVRTYLLRSGFTSVIKDIVTFQPDIPKARSMIFEALRGTNPLLIEVTKIDNGAALPELLNQIVHVLCYRLKYKKHDAFDIATGISEVCQNTFDHNHETCGFIAMQTYKRNTERFIEIAVADYGAGLKSTLQENPNNPEIKTDFDAIKVATQLGTSQFDDPTRGTGLHHLLEIAYKHKGAVEFWSGSAKIRFRMDKRKGWEFDSIAIPGLIVNLSLQSKIKI